MVVMTAKTKHELGIAAIIGIIIALIYWYYNRKFALVTHSMTFNGQPIEQATLQTFLNRLYPNEYITDDGKLASVVNGHITIYAGDPIDVLASRSNNG